MSEIELKPCPFCGAKADWWLDISKGYSVRCKRCDARMLASGAESAIKNWNCRIGESTYKDYFEAKFPHDAFPMMRSLILTAAASAGEAFLAEWSKRHCAKSARATAKRAGTR